MMQSTIVVESKQLPLCSYWVHTTEEGEFYISSEDKLDNIWKKFVKMPNPGNEAWWNVLHRWQIEIGLSLY